MNTKSFVASLIVGSLAWNTLDADHREQVGRPEQPHDHHELNVEHVDVTSPLSAYGIRRFGQFGADAYLVRNSEVPALSK